MMHIHKRAFSKSFIAQRNADGTEFSCRAHVQRLGMNRKFYLCTQLVEHMEKHRVFNLPLVSLISDVGEVVFVLRILEGSNQSGVENLQVLSRAFHFLQNLFWLLSAEFLYCDRELQRTVAVSDASVFLLHLF